jgi:hypothetical protein
VRTAQVQCQWTARPLAPSSPLCRLRRPRPAPSSRPALPRAHAQLEGHLQQLELPVKSCGEDLTPLRRALTAGLFPHAASKQLDGSYKVRLAATVQGWQNWWQCAGECACRAGLCCCGSRQCWCWGKATPGTASAGSASSADAAAPLQVLATGQVVYLHPSSVLLSRKPGCVVFNELVRGLLGSALCALRCAVLCSGCWVLGAGCWVLGAGCWVLGAQGALCAGCSVRRVPSWLQGHDRAPVPLVSPRARPPPPPPARCAPPSSTRATCARWSRAGCPSWRPRSSRARRRPPRRRRAAAAARSAVAVPVVRRWQVEVVARSRR